MIRALLVTAIAAATATTLPQRAEAKGYIGLITRDAGPLAEWYEANFDLVQVRSEQPEGSDLTVTILDGALATVEIITRPDARIEGLPALRTGVFKTGFAVDDLDRWIARWRTAGVTIAAGPFDEEQPPVRSVVLHDPDGNALHLIQPLAMASER